MAIQWTGLGPEVLLRLDRKLPEPLRAQLERELRDAIRAGRLRAGERLPSSRVLARELGISRGLVLECYAQLQAEGYLIAREGSATRVAAGAQEPPPAPTDGARGTAAPASRIAIAFRPGLPDLASFPRRDWAWALRDACRTAPASSFGYGKPAGNLELREVLAAYLRRVRGAVADADRIVICTGFAQAVNIVVRALARRGVRRIGVEDPGYMASERMWAPAPKGMPVPVDEHGIDVDALAATGARAAILTPAHQSPTGVLLAPARRQALLTWAAEHDATIIEDDYDAEFRYDREPVGALQGLGPDRVAGAGSVSKSLAPGLRLGWVLCPPGLADEVAAEKEREDHGSPMLEQLALATLIRSGRYDRHLRRMRAVYARRRDVLVRALERHAPRVRLTGLAAGFHAVAHLPESADEEAVVAGARERSVGLYGMSGFRADGGTRPPQLVLGFGNLGEGAIERGIAAIADLLDGA